MNKPLPVVVSGTGVAVPSEVVSNEHFASYLDTSDEWIVTRTGISQRYKAVEGETTVTLARDASLKAIEDAGLTKEDIDLIILCTVTPDTHVPAGACWLQAELGLENVPAFDLNAACAGLVYGMAQASMCIASGFYKHVLVVGAETLSRVTNYQDRSTCILFGDGAAGVVLSRTDDLERGVIYHELGTHGGGAEHIVVPAGGSRLPTSQMTLSENLGFIQMNGREVYKFAVSKFNELTTRVLEKTGYSAEDLDLIIPHQSNLRIIESVKKKMGLPMEKFGVNIDRWGNTSSASVGLVLDEVRRNGQVKQGDLVLMIAFGAGLTWGSVLMRL